MDSVSGLNGKGSTFGCCLLLFIAQDDQYALQSINQVGDLHPLDVCKELGIRREMEFSGIAKLLPGIVLVTVEDKVHGELAFFRSGFPGALDFHDIV